MPYIGRGIETLSDRVVLDSLTASATASYTLQLNSVNFVPSSASSLTVSLNGVIQKPDSSYTVSGSTLTFSSALTSSDSIDFIIAERGITLQTPSAGSVGTSQLASNAVTAAKINDGEITNAKINSSAAIATTKLGTGAVLQVVKSQTSTQVGFSTVATNTFIFEASITPSSTSNKILALYDINGIASNAASANRMEIIGYWDTSSGGTTGTVLNSSYSATDNGPVQEITSVSFSSLFTPATTSTIYVKARVYTHDTGNVRYVNVYGSNSTITLMEIAG